jgi:PadR family transcriptional regulator PadR
MFAEDVPGGHHEEREIPEGHEGCGYRQHHYRHHHEHMRHLPMRGALHLLILKLLEERPLYGAEIKELLKSRLDLDIPSSAVYAILGILEEKGMVVSSWETTEKGAARKVYKITEEGDSYLKEKVENLKRTKKVFDFLLS